ncbi:septum formation inhibitor Maf [Rhizobium sp. Root274]|uniref:Maf family protein n=1 Tax=unclassified Rhizobium TaxID=2613769 RepID=UPI0007156D63|nr:MULTISPECIES: Maf family protein [unclassified Rhizobium]KQW27827.1 septum formation inhibitor Maf [Rhizobium sp. Root1240]KRD28108.1 septum formation inhibitor Maf [Rhizobium sp. Root274]
MATSLILASASSARRSLLANAGLDHIAGAAQVDERQVEHEVPEAERTPSSIAIHLAIAKARTVSMRHPLSIVIGCDQTMSLGSELFHKAPDLLAAKQTLQVLRGKTHHLNSAICLVRNGEVLWNHLSVATMRMRHFSDEFLDAYLERNGSRVLGSVGCYQLEGEGIQLFEAIEGDYFTILGLPMLPLLEELRKLGVNHA